METEPFLKDSPSFDDVPPRTKWSKVCCFFWMAENSYDFRFRYISLKFFPVYPELALYFYMIYAWIHDMRPLCDSIQKSQAFFIFYIFLYISSLICFFCAYCMDPGYLPYFFSKTNKKKFTLDEIKEGTATRQDQIQWAKEQPRPNRCSFSSTQGRYILRADHNCVYIGNWVGLHNHRYFLLAIFYMGICVLYYFICVWILFFRGIFPFRWYTFIIHIGISGAFAFLLLNNLKNQMTFFYFGITGLEYLKKSNDNYNKGLIGNLEEICGSRKYLFLWLLPIPLPNPQDGFSFQKIDDGNGDYSSEKELFENEAIKRMNPLSFMQNY